MMIGRVAAIVIILIGFMSIVFAQQYVELWSSPSTGQTSNFCYVGCGNTDVDNANEIVLTRNISSGAGDDILVIDGVSGTVEWTLSPPWASIYVGYISGSIQEPGYARLIDVDNDGRNEILFYGRVLSTDSMRYHLYGYSGGYVDDNGELKAIYQDISLAQNYPNPACNITNIQYSLTRKSRVLLKMYNAAGQLVRTLDEGEKEAGSHIVIWDCRDDKGMRLSSGSYFYQLIIDGISLSRKMVNLK